MKNSELSDFRRKTRIHFQEFNLIDTLNAKDNILLPLAVERMTKEEMEKSKTCSSIVEYRRTAQTVSR